MKRSLVSRFSTPKIFRRLALSSLVVLPLAANADCPMGSMLCASYDFNAPVNITNTVGGPSLTVMDGSVGIGTTTPLYPLTISGSAGNIGVIRYGPAAYPAMKFHAAGGAESAPTAVTNGRGLGAFQFFWSRRCNI